VRRYRLHLAELIAADRVRFERDRQAGDEVRLRFYGGAGGVVCAQARTRPGITVGRVRA
jgi:hypothetical protein